MPIDDRLRDKIRRRRKSQNLTQSELAEIAGLGGPTTISAIESGKAVSVRLSTLDAIAQALGCTIKVLMEEESKDE